MAHPERGVPHGTGPWPARRDEKGEDGDPAPGMIPEPLRVVLAGSVDDGKSTLLGRLLLEAGALPADQLESVEAASLRRGEAEANLALVTDGLRAEREQGITIDVAYRYITTRRRSFIVADTPGHEQYTRNMVTGASGADLVVLLVDARRGITSQTRRHAFLAALLGVPQGIVVVNKMDQVDWSEARFEALVSEVRAFSRRLTLQQLSFIPVSALRGDNVLVPSPRMPWYQGGSLLHLLESAPSGGRRNAIDMRFPVQLAIRPHADFRGVAGTVASGTVRPGDEVVVLPSGHSTRVRSVETHGGSLREAGPGEAVVLTLEDALDVARGHMLVRPRNLPQVEAHLEAYLCWLDERPLEPGLPYRVLHTTRSVRGVVEGVDYRIDVDSFRRTPTETLHLNEIGRVELRTSDPLFFDSYRVNTATGSFVLVDPRTHDTVAAGMIRGAPRRLRTLASPDVVWEGWNIERAERETAQGHRALVVWLTGRPAAGKTTLAREVERRLFREGVRTMLLDGDQLRHGLNGDLGFSPGDRKENLRRVGEVAHLFFRQGAVVLCAFVSPFRADREALRARFPEGRFLEVHVTAPHETLRARDPKGLYRRVEAGELRGLTGVDAPWEPPEAPELVVDTHRSGLDEGGGRLHAAIRARIAVP